MDTRGTPVLDTNGDVEQIVLVTRDIRKQKQREDEYKYQANHDHLTHLPNRRLFEDNLTAAMKISKRYKRLTALVTLDCDRFKQINDTYGHDIGDGVIIEFSTRIKSNIREGDTASRMGGDEFHIILPELDSKQIALSVVDKILKNMAEPFNINGQILHLTTSIGISFYEGDYKNIDALVKESDKALYEAKKNGKNTSVLYEDINKPIYSKWNKFKNIILNNFSD